MIKVNGLCFDYPNKRALHDLSFEIQEKTITALVGPNGAGKTTLLRCLAGLESWTQGLILMDGIDVEENPRQAHKVCSYLSDFFGLYDDLTVEQSLLYIAMSRGAKSHEEKDLALKAAQLLQLNDYYTLEVGTLSRGLRQRVAIAQTIVVPPKILILDEPASGLDPEARFELSKLLIQLQEQHEMTIIVSSHILAELEDYSTHMLKIDHGRLVTQRALASSEPSSTLYELVLGSPICDYENELLSLNLHILKQEGQTAQVKLPPDLKPDDVIKTLVNKNIPVQGFRQLKQSMQEVYLTSSEGDDHAKS